MPVSIHVHVHQFFLRSSGFSLVLCINSNIICANQSSFENLVKNMPVKFVILTLVKSSSAFLKRFMPFTGPFRDCVCVKMKGRKLLFKLKSHEEFTASYKGQPVIGPVAMPLIVTCLCRFHLVVQQLTDNEDAEYSYFFQKVQTWYVEYDPFSLQFKIAENKGQV